MPAILPLILQYGIPAGLEGLKFLEQLIAHMRAHPKQTQAEFAADWVKMQAPYRTAGTAWDNAGQSPNAKA